jgi:hypothetical protein
MYQSEQIWLCVLIDSSSFSWSTQLGMEGRNSTVDGKNVISFQTNNSSYNITTFLEFAFNGDPSGDTRDGYWRWFQDPLVFTQK